MTVKAFIKKHANSEREKEYFLTKCGNYLSEELKDVNGDFITPDGPAGILKMTISNGSICIAFSENRTSTDSDNWLSF